jgi:hypothetical protein
MASQKISQDAPEAKAQSSKTATGGSDADRPESPKWGHAQASIYLLTSRSSRFLITLDFCG